MKISDFESFIEQAIKNDEYKLLKHIISNNDSIKFDNTVDHWEWQIINNMVQNKDKRIIY